MAKWKKMVGGFNVDKSDWGKAGGRGKDWHWGLGAEASASLFS